MSDERAQAIFGLNEKGVHPTEMVSSFDTRNGRDQRLPNPLLSDVTFFSNCRARQARRFLVESSINIYFLSGGMEAPMFLLAIIRAKRR